MAYQADILINVRGFQDLARIQKQLEGTARKIDEVNKAAERLAAPVRNIERFSRQLKEAEKALQKVAIGSPQEQRAISNYVTALNNSNVARDRQNKLIQTEINVRNAATNAIRANVEANIAESRATRAARAEAQRLNAELVQQERLRRKLAERGLMQLSGGGVAKGVADAGFGIQGPAPARPTGIGAALQKPGVSDAIIGAGFPALFGGGPGAILGGGLGGLAGGALGGGLGFALSVGLSAIGQKLDEAVQKVKQVGEALNALNIDKLRDSFVFINAELDTTVRRLIEAGNAEAARAALANEVALQTGAVGTAIQDSSNAANLLSNTWNEFGGAVSSLLSIIAAPFAAALSVVVKLITEAVKGVNFILTLVGGGLKAGVEAIIKLFPGGEKALKGIKESIEAGNEEQQKLKAALIETTDAANRQLVIGLQQAEIDKKRTQGITTIGKLINLQADTESKNLDIRTAAEDKIRELRIKYAGVTDAAGKRELELAIKQIQAQANLQKQEAARVAERQKLKILNDDIVAKDRLQLAVLQASLEIENSRSNTKQQLLAIQVQELEQRRSIALSLNEESALIDSIASTKISAAQETFQQVQQELNARKDIAAAELNSVAAQFERGFATEEQLKTAQLNLQVVEKTTSESEKVARAVLNQAVNTAELERRQQQVAAFAADAANQTERFNRASNESLNALNNNVRALDAFTQAQTTINNLEVQSLENKLAQVSGDAERSAILGQIRNLEIDNAKLVLQATRTQIAAEVERQRIALAQAEVKFRELEAVVRLAAAQGVLNRQYLEALDAQRSAVVIAQQNLETSIKVAAEQDRAAVAVFNAAVNAANLRSNLEGSASAANSLANAAERTANAAQIASGGFAALGGAASIQNPILRAAATALAQERAANPPLESRATGFNVEPLFAVEEFTRQARLLQKGEELLRAYQQLIEQGLTAEANAGLAALSGFEREAFQAARALEDQRQRAEQFNNTLSTLTGSALNAAAALNNIAPGPNSNPEAAFAAGGYVTRPTRALVAEAGEPEYIIPRSKMTEAMQRYAAGARGEAVIPGGGSTLQPQVNITTGPVMQMNGTSYVTQADLVTATSTAAKQGASMALQMLQNSPKARRSAGVTR